MEGEKEKIQGNETNIYFETGSIDLYVVVVVVAAVFFSFSSTARSLFLFFSFSLIKYSCIILGRSVFRFQGRYSIVSSRLVSSRIVSSRFEIFIIANTHLNTGSFRAQIQKRGLGCPKMRMILFL